jgi:cytochrome c5
VALAAGTTAVVRTAPAEPAASQARAQATVLDGVYTSEQAARGKLRYAMSCSACHQDMLTGTDVFPALAGDEFVMRWEERKVEDLLRKITTQMPPDGSLALPDQEWLDLIAYVLEVNRYPAGSQPLAPGPALHWIEFVKPR